MKHLFNKVVREIPRGARPNSSSTNESFFSNYLNLNPRSKSRIRTPLGFRKMPSGFSDEKVSFDPSILMKNTGDLECRTLMKESNTGFFHHTYKAQIKYRELNRVSGLKKLQQSFRSDHGRKTSIYDHSIFLSLFPGGASGPTTITHTRNNEMLVHSFVADGQDPIVSRLFWVKDQYGFTVGRHNATLTGHALHGDAVATTTVGPQGVSSCFYGTGQKSIHAGFVNRNAALGYSLGTWSQMMKNTIPRWHQYIAESPRVKKNLIQIYNDPGSECSQWLLEKFTEYIAEHRSNIDNCSQWGTFAKIHSGMPIRMLQFGFTPSNWLNTLDASTLARKGAAIELDNVNIVKSRGARNSGPTIEILE